MFQQVLFLKQIYLQLVFEYLRSVKQKKSQTFAYNFIIYYSFMRKGHRRTHSETIAISRPLIQNVQNIKEEHKANDSYFQFERPKQKPISFASIQSLLQKSQTNITQRILYIQNLQQPASSNNNSENFTFGKGVNFKLKYFKLNMGQIPQVPKSNQSTSLQGQNKLEKLEKQLYFAHQPIQMQQYKNIKPQKQIAKYSLLHQKRTKKASTVQIKPLYNNQKIEKIEKNQSKNTLLHNIKQNPLKRPKMQYQIHKKNIHSFGRTFTISSTNKLPKQSQLNHLSLNDPKKKKKNLVI